MKQNEQYCREIDISIIIPAFNCAAYIEDCLKSCEIQSFQNFEIIIIDDGSTDSTKEIIHKCCATMQNKCQIIELEDNHGVSYCRNIGLNHAKGTYIFFLDADDIIRYDALEKLYNVAMVENCPVVYCKYRRFNLLDSDVTECVEKSSVYYQRIGIRFEELDARIYAGTIWGGLIKKQIIDDNNLKFDTNIRYGEDSIFKLELFKYVDFILEIDDVLYFWRITPNSLSGTTTFDRALKRETRLVEKVVSLINKEPQSSNYSMLLLRYYRMRKNSVYRLCLDTGYRDKKIEMDSIHLSVQSVFHAGKISLCKILEIFYGFFPGLDTWRIQKVIFARFYRR